MNYHIASDEQLHQAISKVLKSYRSISSQHRFQELIKKELKTKKKQFGISGSRLRLLAIQNEHVKIEIHSREGDPHKILHHCPVCDHQLKRVKNQTIWGGEVTIQFSCPFCGYWTGKKKRIPTRYVFHYKQ